MAGTQNNGIERDFPKTVEKKEDVFQSKNGALKTLQKLQRGETQRRTPEAKKPLSKENPET